MIILTRGNHNESLVSSRFHHRGHIFDHSKFGECIGVVVMSHVQDFVSLVHQSGQSLLSLDECIRKDLGLSRGD